MSKVDKEEETSPFPVVGIGASAGGLEAVTQFLKALPAKSGMAYVFIQHLSPTHVSILPEILQKISPIPVQQITDNIHLEKDNLYIIPENKVVTSFDGVLKLDNPDKKQKKGHTIDLFFSSLGVVHQSYAVGVVLSGALNDGTLGLQIIKSHGGITFAQDEGSSSFDSMPRNAVKAGVVDFVLPPAKIAEHLIAINHPFNEENTEKNAEQVQLEDNDVFKQILTVLRVRRGVDFQYYKTSTLKRRIMRRMALSKIELPADYLYKLRESKSEQDALYNDMLISVTGFFRDSLSFGTLCNQLFPDLIRQKAGDTQLRIWIAGCATGEEAYSMAICLQEQLGDKAATMKIQIFATDISEIAIAKARNGIYRSNELEGLSNSRIQQFFTKLGGSYQVNKSIRDMCVFAHHNLLKDPPFSKVDLVSCRNVLIYLEPVLQKRALTTFHYALNEQGYLMLGKSETIGNHTDIFSPYKAADKIYKRKGAAGRFMTVTSPRNEQTFRDSDQGIQREEISKDIFKLADEIMLLNFMPASVLVNDKFDIVQFRGSTEAWLVSPQGKPSFNVLKMARDGLAFELRNILQQAKKTNLPSRKFGVFFKSNNLQHFVNIHIAPIQNTSDPHYLIVFQAASTTGIQPNMFENSDNKDDGNYNASELRIEHLERELIQARADMRVITEEQESANEELQTANEELLSGSEELQSLNEELETSKEELQSTNEEIIIVNKELVDRNDQLNNARLYTESIVNTIRAPLLILDKNYRVMRATKQFYATFNLNEKETEGSYIYELSDGQWNIPELRELLESVLPEKKSSEDLEIAQNFPAIGRRIMCLNARLLDNINGQQLILLSIEDITDKRKVEEGLAEVERMLVESKERLKFAVESAGIGTWDYNPVIQELIWDSRSKEMFGVSVSDLVTYEVFFNLINEEDRLAAEDVMRQTMEGRNDGVLDIEFRTVKIDEKIKWLKAKGRAYFNEDGTAIRFIGTLLDITEQKLLNEATKELLKKKDEFISIASHELKTPITSLKAALQIIESAIKGKEDFKSIYNFAQKASRQVSKLTILVKDLLDVTRIQSGKLELLKTEFLIKPLILECVEEIQVYSTAHHVNIDCDNKLIVFADRNRMEQVFVNLISNAIKYSPGKERVEIKVEQEQTGIKVSVIDYGIGIEKSKIPFIFDRYFRVAETSQVYAGLGLGLFISSEIIKQHNGEIGIESETGMGSVFWFTLPNNVVVVD